MSEMLELLDKSAALAAASSGGGGGQGSSSGGSGELQAGACSAAIGHCWGHWVAEGRKKQLARSMNDSSELS